MKPKKKRLWAAKLKAQAEAKMRAEQEAKAQKLAEEKAKAEAAAKKEAEEAKKKELEAEQPEEEAKPKKKSRKRRSSEGQFVVHVPPLTSFVRIGGFFFSELIILTEEHAWHFQI